MKSDDTISQEEEQSKHIPDEQELQKRNRDRTQNRRQQTSYKGRKKENNMVKKIVLIIVAVLIMTLSIAGFFAYQYFTSSLKPLDSKNEKLIQVEIPQGSSSKQIGQILEKNKIIKSGLVFSYYVKMNNKADFQAGYYQMSPSMTLEAITDSLQEGGTDEPVSLADAKITIPEGYSVDQIAELFSKETKLSKDDFLDVVKDEEFFNELVTKYPDLLESAKNAKDTRYRLEGYLYPATYYYYKDVPIKDMITQMVDKTNQVLAPYYDQIKAKKMTVQEVLTLASLVEKEGVTPEDRRKIAQVFLNRLAIDMPIQSDISILYAMEEHKVHLSEKDTQIDSPYNLYINKGTGPGPFNNPSQQAIESVLNPEETDALYFLADVSTGKVYYAKTYDEHLVNKKEYIDDKNN
ncbi:aminodeoxychorismate lyase [Vagococcus teuberi]|uniref:Endolytic murein transglycosylase n=2 Tax=Enterococcaceae TaxID=81852 RepID=A0A1J0A8F6_9ENTE|nr:aminodeoxychorismate lyase [Vagococcus teuberi]RHH69610.1 endolytic transglycosylase MltG [Vagococcus sp. AM17-17]